MKSPYENRKKDGLYFVRSLDHFNDKIRTHKRVAIIIYLYYLDILESYFKYINNLPKDIDLYIISSNENVLDRAKKEVARENNTKYILKPNSGRDISALIVTSAKIVKDYDYVCFAHDKHAKKDNKYQISDVELWNRNIWENMIGSPAYIENVLEIFENNENIGLLIPPEPIGFDHQAWSGFGWYDSYTVTASLAKELGLKTLIDKDMPPIALSTALWFRPEALKKLFDYGFTYDDFNDDLLTDNGNYLSYGIERIFPYVAMDSNYETGTVLTDRYAETLLNIAQSQEFDTLSLLNNYVDCGTIREINWQNWAINISNNVLKNQSDIYIYGAGKLGKNIYNYLKYINVRVSSFIVTDSDHVDYIDGIPVLELSPGIIHQNAYYVVAILDEGIQKNICSRLYEMGAMNILSYDYQ